MATDSRVQTAGSTEKTARDGFEIDLVELLYRLLEKARYIILAALLGALIMAVYTFQFVTPTYQATSKLYIVNPKDSVINISDLQLGSSLAADYVEVFGTRDMSTAVKNELGLPYTVNQIRNMLKVTQKANTRILSITVTSTNAKEAMQMANSFAHNAQILIPEKMGTKNNEPTIFEEAITPTSPSAPNKVRNIALGIVIGALATIAVLVIQFIADDRIRNVETLEKRLGLPVLGMMPDSGAEDGSSTHQSGKKSSHRSGGKGGRK